MKKIPMLEKFAAQSLVESDGELIFSKEKFAELIVRECAGICNDTNDATYLNGVIAGRKIQKHFGVEK